MGTIPIGLDPSIKPAPGPHPKGSAWRPEFTPSPRAQLRQTHSQPDLRPGQFPTVRELHDAGWEQHIAPDVLVNRKDLLYDPDSHRYQFRKAYTVGNPDAVYEKPSRAVAVDPKSDRVPDETARERANRMFREKWADSDIVAMSRRKIQQRLGHVPGHDLVKKRG
ncbi:hypothetical protein JCM16303_001624 [Sporobolomyces ruberrimus]